jgi:hypothetical protein
MTWVTLVPRVAEPGRVLIFQCAECEKLDFKPRELGGGRFEGTAPAAMGDAADPFRRNAEECRQLAARALKAADKVFWLRLAEDWLKLAQEADKPTKGPLW